MYDAETLKLIAAAPNLEGLDLNALPQDLTKAFATIVAWRVRLRSGEVVVPEDLPGMTTYLRRLAATQEAMVAVSPHRDDRAAAAFVAGSAHLLCHLATDLADHGTASEPLSVMTVAPSVSATVLFLVAETPADAAEMAKRITPTGTTIEKALLQAVIALARGNLAELVEYPAPTVQLSTYATLEAAALDALWLGLLQGVRALASGLLNGETSALEEAAKRFDSIAALAVEQLDDVVSDGPHAVSAFPGPHHLASLLRSLATNLPEAALTRIVPPSGTPPAAWHVFTAATARRRPYLWQNHREAIQQGYLEPGTSAAVSFPTGGGKSTLAELKIAVALLLGHKVVFLAPTLALVDQVANDLQIAFPSTHVQREAVEDIGYSDLQPDELPAVAVMTPERCLAMLSFAPDAFDGVGLLVFDECHLLHPRGAQGDRRSIDAMLCLLAFTRSCPEADLLLMSAMMGNAPEVSSWLEWLTERRCLALVMEWKPTRQARGCVVYDAGRVDELKGILAAEQRAAGSSVPREVSERLTARPSALFCLRQTWRTKSAADYSLQALLAGDVSLSATVGDNGDWYLSANRNVVAASVAEAAVRAGYKTLVFTQNVTWCDAVAKRLKGALPSRAGLTDREKRLMAIAAEEMGGDKHTYCDSTARSAAHHGLLLPVERHFNESLYRRPGGVDVLAATSTLAQGMNLPSEVVVIAGDDRFDKEVGQSRPLEAHELLNTAGRAGRAGEAAQGMVIVVPGKVVAYDNQQRTIHRHWFTLQAIFAKGDQCLDIDDPLTALLDRIQSAGPGEAEDLTTYVLTRLPAGENGDEAAKALLSRSFAAFKARVRDDEDWIASRIDAALEARRSIAPTKSHATWHATLAANCGIPEWLVQDLDRDMHQHSENLGGTANAWIVWFLDWLRIESRRVGELIRPGNVAEVFGKKYTSQATRELKAAFTLNQLSVLLPLWVAGAPLRELELATGVPAPKLAKCRTARKFVARLLPDVAYAFGVVAQVHRHRLAASGAGQPMPLVLSTLSSMVREGFDRPEKLALQRILRRQIGRVGCHKRFEAISQLIPLGDEREFFAETLRRTSIALQT